MNTVKGIIAVVLFFCLFVFLSSVFTVQQGRHAMLQRLGKLAVDEETGKVKVLGPGLHFKYPFIETVRVFDTRIQTIDIKSSRIVTREKKDVIVDYYVKWRIDDLAKYYKATGGNEFKAETLLEQQLNTSLRAQFGKRTIPDVVSGGRDDVMDVLRERAESQAHELGIYVVDVRIKGIELPPSTSNAIYQRMRADMKKIANKHRADGNASAEAIQAEADAKVTVLLAEAARNAERVKAEGQAKAATIYANAFGKDKNFFSLYRSLKAYVSSFNNKQDLLVLDQSSSFFEYFKSGVAKSNNAGVVKALPMQKK